MANLNQVNVESVGIFDIEDTTGRNNLEAHISNHTNPHVVTKTQVGLGNVENVLQYSANNPPPSDNTKADKVVGARSGDFASFNNSGNLVDSGISLSDLITLSDETLD